MKNWARIFFLILFFLSSQESLAQPSSELVAEVESGHVLIKKNAGEELPPASLTKVMTLYLTFGALEKGWLKWDDRLPVSVHAAKQPRTNLNLQTGQTITVKEAVLSLIVHSANDAAVVLAEAMAPTEADFAKIMTQTAGILNMKNTVFKNASGLHEEGQKTTAKDMAIMALAVIKHFPDYYPLFATDSFDFNGRTYTSHNRILKEYQGAEGLKTGYVSASGYNIISTAKHKDIRLVGVVLGQETSQKRYQVMTKLLDEGFEKSFLQKEKVASGKIRPSFDFLHRRFFLGKVDLNLFSAGMTRQINRSKNMANLMFKQNKVIQAQMQLQDQVIDSSAWSIQVGAFSSLDGAREMAARAFSLLGMPSLRAVTDKKESMFKAQLTGFSNKKGAMDACKFLKENSCSCFLISPEVGEGGG